MRVCAWCGSTENITKHHINGRHGLGPVRLVYLCRDCHNDAHGIRPKDDKFKVLKRRIRRAKRRIKRDTKILTEAEDLLNELLRKGVQRVN